MEQNKTIIEVINKINRKYSQDRLNRSIHNYELLKECKTILRMPKGIEYYQYIIDKININSNNTQNSYLMWIFNKTDTLNHNNECKIILGKSSLPDIDVDVPILKREQVINYIKDKYGHDKVSQMITFNTMKGRGALKDVLRVYGNTSFEEMNRITKFIPDESKISDELQEMKEETGESSIIRWALENNAEELKEWCYIDDNGELQGPLAKRFEQAIRLEGTKTNQSKHAAGVAISSIPLAEVCPMIYDSKTKQPIAGMEMQDLENIGIIKLDILGIALLDKVMDISQQLKEGILYE
jgi:hypothetical protein